MKKVDAIKEQLAKVEDNIAVLRKLLKGFYPKGDDIPDVSVIMRAQHLLHIHEKLEQEI